MPAHFPVAAITDEFSPDIEIAVRSMTELGMTGAELRMVFGKNIVDLTDEELDRAIAIVRGAGLEIISHRVAAVEVRAAGCAGSGRPLPAGYVRRRTYVRRSAAAHGARVRDCASAPARASSACFRYWRTVDPEVCFDRIVEALRALADQAAAHNVIIGLENEHACNIATGAETARVLAALDHPNLKVVWDPANAVVSGEKAFPEGYGKLPVSRIQHVHAKDCTMDGHKPVWCAIGEGVVGWRGQVDALVRDGYKGWLSLETHWPGPGGDKHEASMICGRKLVELAQ